MKILLTGSNGQLGYELLIQGNNLDYGIIATEHSDLDITKKIQVKQTLEKYKPSFVINTAAYTHVENAEIEQNLAFAINRDGPANIAEACEKLEIPLIHISTDFIFDGKKNYPYIELDQVSPLNIYGKSKEQGESKVRSILKEHIILRTSWLYGIQGHNFVKTILKLGRERKSINVVADQLGSPTSAADLAEAILNIIAKIKYSSYVNWGTYHYCGHGVTTWHKFAEEILRLAKHFISIKIKNVKPILTTNYPAKAKRPYYSALNCRLIEKTFGISLKPWQKSLKTTIYRLCQKETTK